MALMVTGDGAAMGSCAALRVELTSQLAKRLFPPGPFFVDLVSPLAQRADCASAVGTDTSTTGLPLRSGTFTDRALCRKQFAGPGGGLGGTRTAPTVALFFIHVLTRVLVSWFEVSFVDGFRHFAPLPMFLSFFRFFSRVRVFIPSVLKNTCRYAYQNVRATIMQVVIRSFVMFYPFGSRKNSWYDVS